ncbi:MAG: efflux RND transporter permease subunit [Sterolibacterium sp.]|nr:efflux RND transporter permease subunit [Sterolibacterium sp.]MBP9798523.1 efflux RND transporter permease subunit [Sterolibacterium sp.]
MNVSAWSIRNPIPAILLFLILSLAGILSFRAMEIQDFPDVDLPSIIITASLPGAAPSQMETEVARKMENAIAGLRGLKHIYTHIQDGTATISAEFRLETRTQEALDDVRSAIGRIRSDLPADLREPIIEKLDVAGSPILTYTIAAQGMDDEALSWFIDHDVTKKLLAARGVGSVSRVGGLSREVRIELDPSRMLALNVTAAEVSRQLRRVQQDAAGGRTDIGGIEQTVRTVATVASASELAALEIPLADGRRIRLDRVAHIQDTVTEQRSGALLDGKPVVAFEVTRSRGIGAVTVMKNVREKLAQLKADHPGIEITEAFNFVDPVIDNYEGSMKLLIEGALLAIVVVWVFLRDRRATFISATALPLSIIPTFAIIHPLGYPLSIVTLLSLSLVIGVLVDDAIVEIENIVRHLAAGKTPRQAAMEAADEIGLAVIATTFALIAVFLPTAFMGGIPGKYFVQFGWTASIAVFLSLVVARMLTPMMAAYLMKPDAREHPEPRWLAIYDTWVRACLNHRPATLLVTAGFFLGSFLLVPLLPSGFIPPDDYSQTQVHLSLPPGSTYQDTYAAAEQARQLIRQHPHVKMIYTAIGGGRSGSDVFVAAGAGEVRKATLTLNLSPREDRRGITKQDIERDLRQRLAALPGVRLKIGLGSAAEKYTLVLASENSTLLATQARKVEAELRTIPGIGSVLSSASLVRPELIIKPDFTRMAEQGLTSADIADTLRIATSGDYDQGLAKLNLEQRQIPLVVKLPPTARTDLALLERLRLPGKNGPVMLGSVASLSISGGPAEIDRYDRMRNINFEIELNSQPLGDVERAAINLPSVKNRPSGILQATVGDAESMAELNAGFTLAMSAGVLCIYVVLVLLFKDFIHPLTILLALVLSVPGAFIALFVTQKPISMPSMIGLIMLMGIATKNSILLIDYAIIAHRDHGLEKRAALLDACRKRARPILMTTIAMGAGMLPIALGLGTDPSFRSPMAIVVIGGLISSTFLSLLVIPVAFSYVDQFIDWVRRQRHRLIQHPPPATDHVHNMQAP